MSIVTIKDLIEHLQIYDENLPLVIIENDSGQKFRLDPCGICHYANKFMHKPDTLTINLFKQQPCRECGEDVDFLMPEGKCVDHSSYTLKEPSAA